MDNQTLPILDASTVLAFLQTDESETNYEVTLPSLDELFNAHIAEQTPTDETSSPPPLSSNSTPIPTKTQRGGPKLVLDGYTYSKKRDLKNSRNWICTKNVPLLGWQLRLLRSGRHRFGRNIRRGWAFQETVHFNYQIHVTIDKQVAVISVCVWRKNGWPQACRMSPPDHGSNTFQVGSITFQVTWHRLSNS